MAFFGSLFCGCFGGYGSKKNQEALPHAAASLRARSSIQLSCFVNQHDESPPVPAGAGPTTSICGPASFRGALLGSGHGRAQQRVRSGNSPSPCSSRRSPGCRVAFRPSQGDNLGAAQEDGDHLSRHLDFDDDRQTKHRDN
jgi:hypothetical protein